MFWAANLVAWVKCAKDENIALRATGREEEGSPWCKSDVRAVRESELIGADGGYRGCEEEVLAPGRRRGGIGELACDEEKISSTASSSKTGVE